MRRDWAWSLPGWYASSHPVRQGLCWRLWNFRRGLLATKLIASTVKSPIVGLTKKAAEGATAINALRRRCRTHFLLDTPDERSLHRMRPPSYWITIGTMTSRKKTTAHAPTGSTKTPSRQAIIRAVASSTAIETGQSIRQLERTLRSGRPKRQVSLAR